MRPIVIERFAAYKKTSEGMKENMYCDTSGYVTAGIGVLFHDAADAKHGFKATKKYWSVQGDKAKVPTEEMIEDDYNACRQIYTSGSSRTSLDYQQATKLRLSTKGILELTAWKMRRFEATMHKAIDRGKWDNFPADAQFACIAMMWGPGIWPTLQRNYPALTTAIKEERFLDASQLITFPVNSNAKVRAWLNKSFEFMLANAAVVVATSMDRSLVYWPNKWEYDRDSEIAWEADWMPTHV